MHYPKLDAAGTDLGPLELVIKPEHIGQPLFNHISDQPSVEQAARRLALERWISQGLEKTECPPEMSQLLRQLLRSTDPDVLETRLAEYPDLKRALLNWHTDSEIPAVLKSRAAKAAFTIAQDALNNAGGSFTREGEQRFITSGPQRMNNRREVAKAAAGIQYTVRVAFGEVRQPARYPTRSIVRAMKDRLGYALSAAMGNKDLENVSARVDDPEGATGRLEAMVTLPVDYLDSGGAVTRPSPRVVTTQCIVTAESGFRDLLEKALGPDIKILMSGGR